MEQFHVLHQALDSVLLRNEPENANSDTPRLFKPKEVSQGFDALEARYIAIDDKVKRNLALLQKSQVSLADLGSAAVSTVTSLASIPDLAVLLRPQEAPESHSTAGTRLFTHERPPPTPDSVLAALDGRKVLLLFGLGQCAKISHIAAFSDCFFG